MCIHIKGAMRDNTETFTAAPWTHEKERPVLLGSHSAGAMQRPATSQVLSQQSPVCHHRHDCLSPPNPHSLPSLQIFIFRVCSVCYSTQRWIPPAEPCLAKQKSGCQLSLNTVLKHENPLTPFGARQPRTQGLKRLTKIHNCVRAQGWAGWTIEIIAKIYVYSLLKL